MGWSSRSLPFMADSDGAALLTQGCDACSKASVAVMAIAAEES